MTWFWKILLDFTRFCRLLQLSTMIKCQIGEILAIMAPASLLFPFQGRQWKGWIHGLILQDFVRFYKILQISSSFCNDKVWNRRNFWHNGPCLFAVSIPFFSRRPIREMNAWPEVKNGMIVLVPPSAAHTETTATSIFSFMCTVWIINDIFITFF